MTPAEKVMREFAEAWRRGDVDGAKAMYADDVVAHLPGDNRFSGTYRGREFLRYLDDLMDFTGGRVEVTEVHDRLYSDGHAVHLLRERFERDGEVLRTNRVAVFHVRDGQISEIWVHDEDQRAVDEFFGREEGDQGS